MATAKSYIRPPADIVTPGSITSTSRAERLEGVPEQDITKVIKAFEAQDAKVKVTRDSQKKGLFIVEAFFN